MSLKSLKVSAHSESRVNPTERRELQREVDKMREELTQLHHEAELAPPKLKKKILSEESSIKKEVSSLLLDLGEQIPFAGALVKWLRS